MQSLGDALLENDPLVGLIQEVNFVGWVYNIDYDKALVMTNDLWKIKALGIPHNCFLIAASFNPGKFSAIAEEEREVILLRVIGSARLPQDDQLVKAKIDGFQSRTDKYESANSSTDYDDITRNQIQFHGLECRVLGTFYKRDDQLWLGSDLESFVSATSFNVYRPRKDTLETIVNYVDPIRIQKAKEDMLDLGIQSSIPAFPIGTVRYTSTDRLHRQSEEEKVKVSIQPTDFLGRRTAVLGMTRTGKSNMVKQTVAVVKRIARQGDIKIGQIIYDINGEYANANQQDKGAIADVYPEETVRYRMLPAEGFEELRNNFYEQLQEGFSVIKRELENNNRVTADYIRFFVNVSLEQPEQQERREYERWQRRVAAYKALLYKANFASPQGHTVKFKANQTVQQRVAELTEEDLPNPETGLTLEQAVKWFIAAREANRGTPLPGSRTGSFWVDETLQVLLDMIAQRNQNNNFISGFGILTDAEKYHSPRRTSDVTEEIYKHLEQGKIVILDLSVGDPTLRENISKEIASKIFNCSMKKFIDGKIPPNIVVYIEEAHNLIGKDQELTETWPRLAKEGAKYRIALVYATQEVSSVHQNILANTENWFVTHLNNEREIKELAKFYDFSDFSRSLIRAQDVGFARVKTLSSPFVIPIQIDKFDPELEKQKL